MSLVFTEDTGGVRGGEDAVRRYVGAWVSDGSGVASGTTPETNGTIQAIFNPGSPAPDANYDVTITNDDGVSILALGASDLGANLSATVSTQATPADASGFPILICGEVTVAISGAGASKQGSVVILVR